MTLIERLEAATGPDQELDAAIAVAVSDVPTARVVWYKGDRWFSKSGFGRVPMAGAYGKGCNLGMIFQNRQYTASIDAALTLVPPDWFLTLTGVNDSWHAVLNQTTSGEMGLTAGFTTHPALAICIAALKARGLDNA